MSETWFRRILERPEVSGGILLAALVYSARLAGAPSELTLPFLYLLALSVGVLLEKQGMFLALAAAVSAELVVVVFGAQSPGAAVRSLGFLVAFSGAGLLLFRLEILAYRRTAKRRIRGLVKAAEADARAFRLGMGAASARAKTDSIPTMDASVQCKLGSVEVVRAALKDLAELALKTTNAHTVVLLLPDEDPSALRVHASASMARPLRSGLLVPAHEGVIGAVVKSGAPVRYLRSPTGRAFGDLAPEDARSFIGVPLSKEGTVVAVLVAYRVEPTEFDERDEALLASIMRQTERTMESERIVLNLDRTSYEHERLSEALALLNEALGLEAVAERLLDAVARIKPLSFGAVTVLDSETQEHVILRARSENPELSALEGERFQNHEGGLVVMAMKAGQPVPVVPLHRQSGRAERRIFAEPMPLELGSVKVFPLMLRGEAVGTLVLGDESAMQELTADEIFMLQIAAVHGATTVANAQMYARMERMATTDALTGLVNRRRLMELADESLARADRFGRKVSLLLIDADHFKRVNDSYGHAVGDVVLRHIAQLLRREARRVDVVSRLGGEEFVLLADETDVAGAAILAERIRARISGETIRGSFGEITVTVSVGTSTWPENAASKEQLLERADQALYEAKRAGRNRVEQWGEARCISPGRSAIASEEAGSALGAGPAEAN